MERRKVIPLSCWSCSKVMEQIHKLMSRCMPNREHDMDQNTLCKRKKNDVSLLKDFGKVDFFFRGVIPKRKHVSNMMFEAYFIAFLKLPTPFLFIIYEHPYVSR